VSAPLGAGTWGGGLVSGSPSSPGEEPANPLEAVFEKTVQPYADAMALRAYLPAGAAVVRMKKNEEVPTQTRELEGGGTLKIPVLGALMDSSVAGWQRAGDFDFAKVENNAVALLVEEAEGGEVSLRVVTRAEQGAFLVADLSGMLDALKLLVDNPAFRAFPGGAFLIEALRSAVQAAKEDVTRALREKGAGGAPSLLEQFKAAGATAPKAPKPKGAKQDG